MVIPNWPQSLVSFACGWVGRQVFLRVIEIYVSVSQVIIGVSCWARAYSICSTSTYVQCYIYTRSRVSQVGWGTDLPYSSTVQSPPGHGKTGRVANRDEFLGIFCNPNLDKSFLPMKNPFSPPPQFRHAPPVVTVQFMMLQVSLATSWLPSFSFGILRIGMR